MKHTLILLLFSYAAWGQNKFYPEQIALYHLGSLIKVDSEYFNVKYRTDGVLKKHQTDSMDVFWVSLSKDKYKLKCKYENIEIIEDPSIEKIEVSKQLKKLNDELNRRGLGTESPTFIIKGNALINEMLKQVQHDENN